MKLLEEDVPEMVGIGQVGEDLGAVPTRAFDLHVAEMEEPAEEALRGAHVLDPGDPDGSGELPQAAPPLQDALVGDGVDHRAPDDVPDIDVDEEPEQHQ